MLFTVRIIKISFTILNFSTSLTWFHGGVASWLICNAIYACQITRNLIINPWSLGSPLHTYTRTQDIIKVAGSRDDYTVRRNIYKTRKGSPNFTSDSLRATRRERERDWNETYNELICDTFPAHSVTRRRKIKIEFSHFAWNFHWNSYLMLFLSSIHGSNIVNWRWRYGGDDDDGCHWLGNAQQNEPTSFDVQWNTLLPKHLVIRLYVVVRTSYVWHGTTRIIRRMFVL